MGAVMDVRRSERMLEHPRGRMNVDSQKERHCMTRMRLRVGSQYRGQGGEHALQWSKRLCLEKWGSWIVN